MLCSLMGFPRILCNYLMQLFPGVHSLIYDEDVGAEKLFNETTSSFVDVEMVKINGIKTHLQENIFFSKGIVMDLRESSSLPLELLKFFLGNSKIKN